MTMNWIITFLAFTTCCYSQTSTASQDTEYSTELYLINYPKTWQLDISKTMGTDFILFSPLENDSDKFKENINVITQNLGGQNIDLEKYKQITDDQLENIATDANVFESAVIKSGKSAFYKTTYEMTQGKFRLKISSKCFIKNDKAYLVTFTAEADKYDSYKIIGEQILNSFSLKN